MSKKTAKEQYTKLPYFGIPKLIPFLKPYGKRLLLMISLGIIGSIIDISIPLFQQYAIDNYVVSGALKTIPYFISAYIFALAVQVAANTATMYTASYVEMNIGHDMKQVCFDHLQTLSFSYFNQNSVGYIHSRIMSDTQRMGELVSWVMMDSRRFG